MIIEKRQKIGTFSTFFTFSTRNPITFRIALVLQAVAAVAIRFSR